MKQIRPPLVLIADDDPDMCEMYASYLEIAGYRVQTAADGYEAFQKTCRQRPSVIVLDLQMPRIDGWSALKSIQKNPKTRGTPVIILTGHDFKTLMKPAAMAAGAVSYLMKPCLPERLAAEVLKCLQPSAGTSTRAM